MRSQTARGKKSGQVRRTKTAERDAAIVAAVQRGESMRAVGRAYGLTHPGVIKVVRRGVVTEAKTG